MLSARIADVAILLSAFMGAGAAVTLGTVALLRKVARRGPWATAASAGVFPVCTPGMSAWIARCGADPHGFGGAGWAIIALAGPVVTVPVAMLAARRARR